MSGEKETPKKTTNDTIKGPSVVTSTYDWLDPEKMETQLTSTQNYLKAKSEDFTAFDKKKGNANLAIQARYKAYKDKLDKALQEKDSKKYTQLQDKVSKVANVLEKNKLAESYGLENPDFYVDQKTVLGKDFDDYVKVRNYVGEMYGYKNLGIDVEKDKHGSRMSVQDVTPRQSARASQFVNTGTQNTETNKTREESFDQDITYNLDTKTYGVRFTNPKVQEKIETRLRPNLTEQGLGFKGLKEGKVAEFQNAAKAQQMEKEVKAFKQATGTSIITELPKKRLGTDNTTPQQSVSSEQYGNLAAGTAQLVGGVVEAADKQKNGKKSVGGAALTGAASGAALGTSIMPGWGTAIGGVVGGAAGAISASIGNKKIDKQVAAQEAMEVQAKKLTRFQPLKNTQANMYAKGTSAAATTKPVEVERDEVILRKGIDGSFTKVADFKGGKTHEQGGEPYLLRAGDIIFPGSKRELINKYIASGNTSGIDKERQKLPKEVENKAATGIDYLTPKQAKVVSNSAMPDSKNLQLPEQPTITQKPTVGKTNWWGAIDYVQPLANITRGIGAPEKTTRRYMSAEELQYSDKSAGLRQEAAIADRVRRGNTSTSAQQNRANAGISNAMKSRDLQNIGAAENTRADQIAAINIGTRNQVKQQNLELANRYDEQDLQNKAIRDAYTQQGLFDIGRVAQQQRRDKALDKSQDILLKSLSSNNFEYTGTDGVKYVKDSAGKYVDPKTLKPKPAEVSINTK